MRFRAKIVLGIGLIEAILLTVLVVSALGWLRSSNESQLMHRAALVEGFLDAAARDPIISYDIAGLISLSDDLVNMDEVAYIRFLDDRGRVLARKGPPALLDKPFHGDTSLAMVDDAILDREINIRAGGRIQGRVQYGLNTGTLAAFLNQTRAWALAIILIELVLVVLLSLGLAGWLTRRLTDLRLANDEVAAGNLAHTLREAGGDELADTARAFNTMTARLREARARNEAALKAIQDLASYQHAILDASDSAIIVTDPTGLITHFNPAAEKMLGYPASDLIGKATPECFHDPREIAAYAPLLAAELGITAPIGFEVFIALARRGLSDRREWTWITRDGQCLPVLLSTSGVHAEDGGLLGFMGVAQDISDLRRADQRMREASTVFQSSPVAIMMVSANQRITAVNPAFTNITGYPPEEAIGQTPAILRSGRHDQVFYDKLWEALRLNDRWEGEIWNRRKNGDIYPEWQTISVVRGPKGEVSEYVAMFSDITERKTAEEEIRYRAWHDALTGLPNRNLLDEHLDLALRDARRTQSQLAVMFIDLDHFKTVNDTLGHAMGDQLLRHAAARLHACLRETDTLARQGGDEFVLVLPGIHSAQDAARIAAKIIDTLGAPFDLGGHTAHIGASVGITIYPNDAEDSQALFRNADLAMYRAKASGRNTFQFYESTMTEAAVKRRELEIDLRLELDAGVNTRLALHYQPVTDISTGRCVGAEALVRWSHVKRGPLPPTEFIPLAEETGLIQALGAWILDKACADIARWKEAGIDCPPISVNISSRQVPNGLTLAQVSETLFRHGLSGHDLGFEITEGVLLVDTEATRLWLQGARELGIRIDLDDFGTGYSSLAYLKRFPIDRVKIDKSFVRDMSSDIEDRILIESILAMSHGLRIKVVAEGIETTAQHEALRQLGCDFGQGYLYSKPLNVADFETHWLRRPRHELSS